MSSSTVPQAGEWTVADLVDRFGPLPARRFRNDPEPGTATEEDVLDLHQREGRLYELVDGVLVEKVMSLREAYLAGLLVTFLNEFVLPRQLGFVLGPDGMWRLRAGLIRLPDVAFISWEDIGEATIPDTSLLHVAPRLAIEVLSPSNTARETTEKLDDYFSAGVLLVWMIDPEKRSARVHTGAADPIELDESGVLDGGAVLPGLQIPLARLFERLPH